jgi:DNA polymerase-3 subunit delta
VLIRDVGSMPAATQDALREAAADLPDFLTLIITAERMDKRKGLYKALAKAAATVDLRPLRPAEAKAWIRERLKARGKHAPSQLIEHIFALTRASLSEICNEVDNLIAYMGDNTTVTQSEIDTLVSSRQKEPVYMLSESVANRNFMEAITILRRLLDEGEHELRILWHLDFLVKRFLRAKSLQEEGVREDGIMKALRIQPFLRERFFRQMGAFSLDELRSMYRVIVEWDNKFKSTSRWHPDIDMELLVRKLCVTQEH